MTRTPCMPQTIWSPLRTSRSLRQTARSPFDDDHGVHPLIADRDPAAVEVHFGPVVGRGVEVVRRGGVDVGAAQQRVRRAVHVAAVRRQLLEQVIERRPGAGRDRDRQVRDVLVGAADVEAFDLVRRAMLDDRGEDALEVARVDQVAVGVDGFGRHGSRFDKCDRCDGCVRCGAVHGCSGAEMHGFTGVRSTGAPAPDAPVHRTCAPHRTRRT